MRIAKGKCDTCQRGYLWKAALVRLKDAVCPKCGGKLLGTTKYLKKYPWYMLNSGRLIGRGPAAVGLTEDMLTLAAAENKKGGTAK